ncbi:MAG: peptide chain release factor N(5)-glutamine methyltransferase [Hyphomicrobiaceae bacterium]
MTTVAQYLSDTRSRLAEAGVRDSLREARRLMAAALGHDSSVILVSPSLELSVHQLDRLERWVGRRCRREPLSRIEGRRQFWGRDFIVTPAVLDPRPETELLIEVVLDLQRRGAARPQRVLDVGTGSGCLAVTLAAELPQIEVVGLDLSTAALDVARENARRIGVADRTTWIAADIRAWEPGGQRNGQPGCPFDLVVSNPPYIARDEIRMLEPEVRDFDPSVALDGGTDGLDFYRALAGLRAQHAIPWLICEVGFGQAEAVADLARSAKGGAALGGLYGYRDLAGVLRCVAIRTRMETLG